MLPPSTVKTEAVRSVCVCVWGGGLLQEEGEVGVEVEEGGSIFALLCQLLRQQGAFCNHVGLLSGLRLAPGRKL